MKGDTRTRIFSVVVGLYLVALSVIMLWTVFKAIPDGATIYVNYHGSWETIGDIVCLFIGIVLGMVFAIQQVVKLGKRQEG